MTTDDIAAGDIGKLRVLSELLTRSGLASRLGKSFSGARDLYEVLGYTRSLQFEDYWSMFERGRLGARIVTAPVNSTWHGKTEVWEGQEAKDTQFEKDWKDLDKKHQILPKMVRLDILAGIGRYAVLLMGFNDSEDFATPLTTTGSLQLLYIQPYHEDAAKITDWDKDPRSPRYGKPVTYTINANSLGSTPGGIGISLKVHYSRVIHIAEGLLDNDVYGKPRLRSVYNSVQDLEKIAGGSAEMFWQGAMGGKAFSAREGATLDPVGLEAEIDEYIHGLRRYVKLQNMDIQDLTPGVSDPKSHIDIQLDLIAGETGIPKRILIGSERGELASSQDEGNWNSRVQQRREQFAEPFILRPFIDKMLELKILPTPKDDYQVQWADLSTMDAKTKAEIGEIKAKTIAAYIGAPGAEMIVPEEFFLSDIIDLDSNQIERIKELRKTAEPLIPIPEEKEEPEELDSKEPKPEDPGKKIEDPNFPEE